MRKTDNYNSVRTDCIVDYIEQYNKEIEKLLEDRKATENTNRTTLKSIAVSLETVVKQLSDNR